MKRKYTIYILAVFFLLAACKEEDLVSEFGSAVITAKSKTGEVLNKAHSDFSVDAQLSAVYGWNVNSQGQVDLQKTNNAFVYVVQSDALQSNEFYVPVYKSSPIKSPINFSSMIALIKNAHAKDILETVFGKLATIHIDPTTPYDDSPDVLDKMFARNDVITFRANNPGAKFDMFLLPSKSLDSMSVSNSADWVVNFYGDSSSLVLWQHPGNGTTIDVLSN